MDVLIAEDSGLLRDGLAQLLTLRGHRVVGVASDAEELLRLVESTPADVAVVDVRMPPHFTDEGVRAALTIRATHPELGVLLLSQSVETRYARRLLTDHTGGVGYLLKDRVIDVDDFTEALERVAAGGTALDPTVVATLLRGTATSGGLATLTPREHQVLSLMAEGLSNSTIAADLHVSGRAVEKSISGVFVKLGLAPSEQENRRVLAVLRFLGVHE